MITCFALHPSNRFPNPESFSQGCVEFYFCPREPIMVYLHLDTIERKIEERDTCNTR